MFCANISPARPAQQQAGAGRQNYKAFRMKIAMIGQKGIPAVYGGVERHVEELSLELGKMGHAILVYARKWFTAGVEKPMYKGVTVKVLPTLHTKHFDAIINTLFATLHAIFVARVDIIHYHGVGPALLAWIPRVLSPRTKVVITFHCIDRYHQKWGPVAKWFLRLGERAACKFPHHTIAVSKTIQKYCLNEYRTLATYIPNGVVLPSATGRETIAQFGLEKNRYILMVSRLVPHKGAHYLLAAWQYACKENPHLANDYKLVIVGGSTFTDDYVETLHTMAERDKSVVFTDWQKGQALSELYENAALFVHPSENEGLPITVLQAMAHARAVLVSDIPEHQELITDQKYLCKTANVGSLADKIVALLLDTSALAVTGAKNRAFVATHFNWVAIANTTSRLYGGLASEVALAELQLA